MATRFFSAPLTIPTRWPFLPAQSLAVLAIAGAALIWGTSSVATKAALAELPPFTLAVARVGVGYLALRFLLRRTGARPARGSLPVLLGLSGFVGFMLFRNAGLRLVPAGDGSLIEGGATPALAMLLAAALLGERPSRRRVVGLLVALAGVLVTVLPGREATGATALVGDGLLFAGTFCFAFYTVLGRRACGTGGSLAVVAGAMRYGLLVLTPVAAAELLTTELPTPGPRAVVLALYLGVTCSGIAYALWGYGLSRLEAGSVALLGNLELVFGVATAAVILGEAVTPTRFAGVALILAGVGLTTTRRVPRVRALHRNLTPAPGVGTA